MLRLKPKHCGKRCLYPICLRNHRFVTVHGLTRLGAKSTAARISNLLAELANDAIHENPDRRSRIHLGGRCVWQPQRLRHVVFNTPTNEPVSASTPANMGAPTNLMSENSIVLSFSAAGCARRPSLTVYSLPLRASRHLTALCSMTSP